MSLCFAICSLLSLCSTPPYSVFSHNTAGSEWRHKTTAQKIMLGAKTFTSFFLFLLLPLNNFVVGTQHLAWVQTTTYPPPPPYPVLHRCSLKRETYLHCYEKLFRFYVPQLWLFKTSTNFNKISVEVQRLPASALVVFVTVERSFVTESENNSNQRKHFGD